MAVSSIIACDLSRESRDSEPGISYQLLSGVRAMSDHVASLDFEGLWYGLSETRNSILKRLKSKQLLERCYVWF